MDDAEQDDTRWLESIETKEEPVLDGTQRIGTEGEKEVLVTQNNNLVYRKSRLSKRLGQI